MSFTLALRRGLCVAVAGLILLGGVAYADDLQELSRLAERGEYAQALSSLNLYLLTHQNNAQAQFLKGVILARQNKREDAIAVFATLTERHPEYPEPYNNLAVLYAEQGQYDKARQVLEMAINTNPSYATAHQNLGGIYAKMASDAYDKALQVDRANAQPAPKLTLISMIPEPGVKRAPPKLVLNTVAPVKPVVVKPQSVVTPVVPPKPMPGPPAAGKPAAPPAAVDQEKAIMAVVEGWAKAWSAKDVPTYLAFYAEDFSTPGGEPRAEWAKGRKERISRPASIRVKVESPKIKLQGGTATVAFRQEYKAGDAAKRTRKTLYLRQMSGKWLIVKEEAGQ